MQARPLLNALAFLIVALTLQLGLTSTAEAKPRKQVRVAQQTPEKAPKRSSVASIIQKARDMYEDQRYEESIQTLSGVVVRADASRDERLEAHKLLAFNNIALGKTEEADSFVRAIYVMDETFELPKTESPKFRDFFEKSKKQWEADGKPGKSASGEPASDKKPVIIKHNAVAQIESGAVLKIEGTIEDPDVSVETVDLFYRSGTSGKFTKKSLAYSMGAFRGEIPASIVTPPLVEYYVLALAKGGLPLASRGDADSPLRVLVPEESKSVIESPWFWIPIGAVVVTGVVLGAVLGTQLGGSESTVKINVTQ